MLPLPINNVTAAPNNKSNTVNPYDKKRLIQVICMLKKIFLKQLVNDEGEVILNIVEKERLKIPSLREITNTMDDTLNSLEDAQINFRAPGYSGKFSRGDEMINLLVDKEFEALIPALNMDEFKILEANIINNGVQDSIKIWHGIIVDGHNRYKIAQRNNIPFNTSILDDYLPTRQDVIEWIITNQIGRRNLSTYDKGLLALKLQDVLKVKGKDNMSKGGKEGSQISVNCIDSQKEAAKNFNISHDTLNKVKHIEAKATPHQKERLKKNEVTINNVYNTIRKEENRAKIASQVLTIPSGATDIFTTSNKYKVIYADPPWPYSNNMGDTTTAPKDHYKLMSLDEICDLPIKKISEENSVLFLWVVVPLLEEALKVVKAWGYTYKTHFVWDKVKHNMGYYSSVRHELLFVCTKGKCLPDVKELFDSVHIEERAAHSKKPEHFRKIIDTLYYGNKIELFARTKAPGWAYYGNEIL